MDARLLGHDTIEVFLTEMVIHELFRIAINFRRRLRRDKIKKHLSYFVRITNITKPRITPAESAKKSFTSENRPSTNDWWYSSEAAYKLPMIKTAKKFFQFILLDDCIIANAKKYPNTEYSRKCIIRSPKEIPRFGTTLEGREDRKKIKPA